MVPDLYELSNFSKFKELESQIDKDINEIDDEIDPKLIPIGITLESSDGGGGNKKGE